MLAGELATAASAGRQIAIVVFDDGYYNALRIYQQGIYQRLAGVTLNNPDFLALASAYGAPAWRVAALDDLAPALRAALNTPGLALVDIAIDPLPLPDRYERRLEQMTR